MNNRFFTLLIGLFVFFNACQSERNAPLLPMAKETRIVLIGNNLGSRMMDFGDFERQLHVQFPDSQLFIRNMCAPGNTAGFRPHPSRNSPWAFEGAAQFNKTVDINTGSEGHFPTEDQWITLLKPDVLLAFFGYNESFRGDAGLADFKGELSAFITHTKTQKYKDGDSTRLVLVSPIAFEDLSDTYDLPDGKEINSNLTKYTQAMDSVAKANHVIFVDVYAPSKEWYEDSKEALTIDGSQLNSAGYQKLGDFLSVTLFGEGKKPATDYAEQIKHAVVEKNWMWQHDFKMPNGVHAYGRRYNPFGPDNYPFEVQKIRAMTAIRDTAIWAAAQGKSVDLAKQDAQTPTLPEVKTNYNIEENGSPGYLYGQDALDKFHLAPGYKIELFASEKEFPDMANPMQLSFDSRGRLWVATMPSYPHWKPGDGKPNDKIIVLEDTNGDGKADKQFVFADSLHLPIGFEFAPEGVYVSQSKNLVLLKDTNGDGKADSKEIILSGFDDHDTHHAHSTYSTDASGAIYMTEGVFLHTNVETSYGPVRATNGGFYRYSPQQKKLERVAQLSVPNPWGLAFDQWGQVFYAETSGPDVRWMLPGTVNPRYGEATDKSFNLVDSNHRVRPTSGLEFVSSRHFPADVQGDFLINNTIGFLGTKQHTLVDDGTGYHSQHRQDLLWSDDKNFRPVDMEFAPDGSLYLVDWHNTLIGHMQHNARDPLRDHVHGRIYRITYPSRPLVKPAKIFGATVDELLSNLLLPEDRTRSRTRAELRTRDVAEVIKKTKNWVTNLDQKSLRYEHHLLEGLWVTWGMNAPDAALLKRLLNAKDYHVQAAAVHVLRYTTDKIPDYKNLFFAAAKNPQGRVRLEAIAAASWLQPKIGLEILQQFDQQLLDHWMKPTYETAVAHLKNKSVNDKSAEETYATTLTGNDKEQFKRGALIFAKDGYCITCHQPDGKGLVSSGFPPLANTPWVTGNPDRLIKITLNGLLGPIEVSGNKYPGQVPMTPFGGMLSDQDVADVLTFVRNAFGNKASPIAPAKVKEIRASIQGKKGFFSPAELLQMHPLER